MKSATIYSRVSTEQQASEGISLEAQIAKARTWCEANGYQLAGIHQDAGISGKRASNRPGLQAALAEVTRNGGCLIVYSLSRLARSTKDCIEISERIERAGADLVSLSEKIDTTSAAGRMVFRMLAVLAEFERDLVSERTKSALAHKRAKGERIGQVPFGFELAADGVALVPNATEQAALAELRVMRASGLSWQQIADALNANGIKSKQGKAWSWATARKVGLYAEANAEQVSAEAS